MTELELYEGLAVEMRCGGCRKWFAWTVTAEHGPWQDNVPAYCRRGCKKRRRNVIKNSQKYVPCPRPEKRLYRTEKEAEVDRKSLALSFLQPFTIYHCVCGGIHVGRVPTRLPLRTLVSGKVDS